MPIDFPNSPTNGDTYSAGGKNWQYNGTSWVLQGVVPTIPTGSITESQLAANSVTTAKIAAGAVVEADIATGAVTAGKIDSSAVTEAKIASSAVTAGKIASNAVTHDKLHSTLSAVTICTSSTKPASPFDGQVIYMTNVDQTAVWDGSAWVGLDPSRDRNVIINGAFNIWQRGTSIPLPLGGGGYVADRWWYYNNGFTSSLTRELCGSTLPQFRYCARIQRNSGQTGTAAMILFSPQETSNSMRFAGKNATVSFYARMSSGASRATTMDMSIITGTGTDQSNFGGAAYTNASQIAYINPTLTTSWQRFSVTGAVASTATEIGLQIGFIPTGTAGASDYFEITGIQLEEGAVATPFEFEDYGTTLQKCQRYYQKSYNQETAPGATGVTTGAVTTGILSMVSGYGFAGKTYYPTPMRVSPTVTTYSYGAGTTGVISDAGNGSDKGAGTASVIWQGANGFDVYNLSGTNITSSYGFMYHYTASAEL